MSSSSSTANTSCVPAPVSKSRRTASRNAPPTADRKRASRREHLDAIHPAAGRDLAADGCDPAGGPDLVSGAADRSAAPGGLSDHPGFGDASGRKPGDDGVLGLDPAGAPIRADLRSYPDDVDERAWHRQHNRAIRSQPP